LLLCSTIVNMRNLINGSNTINKNTFYKLNSKTEQGIKLLLIPPSNGEGLVYKNIAIKLDGFIEVWTLDFTELSEKIIDSQKFSEILCNSWILEHGNEGFYLGGYSIGFRLAYFMGLQLNNQILKLINLDGIIYKDEEDEKRIEKIFEIKNKKNTFETFSSDNSLEELIFTNEYYISKLITPIVHFLCEETINEGLQPTFCSDNNEIILIQGNHNSFIDYEENIILICDNIICRIN
jgi:hypothetical protein